MEFIYYTIAAIALYGLSDFILNRIEIKMGKRLPNRSFIFLIIIMVLSISLFNLLQSILVPLDSNKVNSVQQTQKLQAEPVTNKQPTNK